VPFKVAELKRPEVKSRYGSKLVLVRPDGFVCWRSDKVPANPLGVIDRVRGEVTAQIRKSASPQERTGETSIDMLAGIAESP
jgi:hypothetical protein